MPILYKHTHRHGHQLDVHRTADLLLRCKFHPRMCGNFRIPSLKEYILIALESRKYSATNSQTYLSPFSEKRRTSCFVLLSLRHHSDKKNKKNFNIFLIIIDGLPLKISASNIQTSLSQQNGKTFFFFLRGKKHKALNTKIHSVLTAPRLCWLQCCSFPRNSCEVWGFPGL